MNSVVVTPLLPPFTGPVVHFRFADFEKVLALSPEDAWGLEALVAGSVIGREVLMERVGEDKIRISVVQ